MRSITHEIEHSSRQDVFNIIPISDAHLGHIAVDEKLLRSTIERVKEPNTYWIGLGDICDAIGRTDKRHREESYAPWCQGLNRVFAAQRAYAIEMFKPIGHKCLGYGMGNHEETLESHGNDLYYSVLEGIVDSDDESLAYGMSGYIVLKFKRGKDGEKRRTTTIRIYVHHGGGGGRKMGSKALRLEDLYAAYDADIYIVGHTHAKIVFPMQRVYVNSAGRMHTKDIYLCNTGGFMKNTVDSTAIYPERKMLKPQALGSIEIQIKPGADNPADVVRVTM